MEVSKAKELLNLIESGDSKEISAEILRQLGGNNFIGVDTHL